MCFISLPKRTTPDIIANIANEYGVEANNIKQDIKAFIDQLYNGHFVLLNGKESKVAVQDDSNTKNKNIEALILEEMAKKRQLYSATLEITYRCNEKCIHCYVVEPDNLDLSRELNTQEYIKILDELYDLNCLHIVFTGGDPFVRTDFIEIYNYARSKNFAVDIFTNAQILMRSQFLSAAFCITCLFQRQFTHNKKL